MGPTARFSTVLRPWRARRGKGCARSSEIKFFLSLRTIGRVRRERESEKPEARTRIRVDFMARGSSCRLFLSRSLSLTLSLSPFLSRSSLPRLSPFPCPLIPECGRTGAQMGYRYREGTNFEILDFLGRPLRKIKVEQNSRARLRLISGFPLTEIYKNLNSKNMRLIRN